MTTALERVATAMDDIITVPMHRKMVGRKLVYKTVTLPEGTMNVDRIVIADMGDAIITYQFPDDAKDLDNIDETLSNEKLAVISKRYKIPYAMAQAFLLKGIDIDNAAAISAAWVCADKENTMIIDGWKPNGSTYEINGLYQGAGNSVAGADFDTFGQPTDSVAAALAENDADGADGYNYNLVLNPIQYWQLMSSKSTTGVPEKESIMDLLNSVPGAPPGDIFKTTVMTAGTGLISPVDPEGGMIDLVRTMEFQNVPGTDSKMGKFSPYYMTVVGVERLRIKQPNSLTKLTAI